MAYTDGSESIVALAGSSSELTNRLICILQSLHIDISDFDLLESADEDSEEDRSVSVVWNGGSVSLHDVLHGRTGTLTSFRAAICAIFKTTKVSTLGKTTDITCKLLEPISLLDTMG